LCEIRPAPLAHPPCRPCAFKKMRRSPRVNSFQKVDSYWELFDGQRDNRKDEVFFKQIDVKTRYGFQRLHPKRSFIKIQRIIHFLSRGNDHPTKQRDGVHSGSTIDYIMEFTTRTSLH